MATFNNPRKTAATVTASATLAKGFHTPVDATATPIIMTLPTGTPAGVEISVEKVDSSANAVTIQGTMRGASGSTISLTYQFEGRTFLSEGNGSWRPTSDHRTSTALTTLVTTTLAADSTPKSAAAAAVATALASSGAVAGGVVTEPAVVAGKAAGGFLGENDRTTDLVIDKDGNVLDDTIQRWGPRIAPFIPQTFDVGDARTAVGGFVGENERLTELVVDATGQVPADVLAAWGSRMGAITAPVVNTSIACWGDSQTGQVFDAVTWPMVTASTLGVPYATTSLTATSGLNNFGFPGETSVAIAAKSGAGPVTWTAGGTIPASGFVDFIAKDQVDLLRFWRTISGTIAGVHGTLASRAADPANPISTEPFRFTRDTPGSAVTVPPNAVFVSDYVAVRGVKTIIMSGRNNTSNPTRIIADIRAQVEALTSYGNNFIVLSEINGGGRATVNSDSASRYGSRYVDVLSYLASAKAMTDIGLTPTTQDNTDIAAGNVPTSLMVNDGVHMNGNGLTAMGRFMAQVLIAKGWV